MGYQPYKYEIYKLNKFYYVRDGEYPYLSWGPYGTLWEARHKVKNLLKDKGEISVERLNERGNRI